VCVCVCVCVCVWTRFNGRTFPDKPGLSGSSL